MRRNKETVKGIIDFQNDFERGISLFNKATGFTLNEDFLFNANIIIESLYNYAVNAVAKIPGYIKSTDVDKYLEIIHLLSNWGELFIDLRDISNNALARCIVDKYKYGSCVYGDIYLEEYLSDEQLAFLSGLKMQTIRNLRVIDKNGNPKISDGIKIIKIHNKNVVAPKDAAIFLNDKRSYKETKFN